MTFWIWYPNTVMASGIAGYVYAKFLHNWMKAKWNQIEKWANTPTIRYIQTYWDD